MSLQSPTRLSKHTSYRKRYEQILVVLARHGFGSTLVKLQQDHPLIPLQNVKKPVAADKLTPSMHLRLALEELGPTFIKLGQLLSTRQDLLDPETIWELSKLQDAALPERWEEVRAVIIADLGNAPEQIFAQIDPVPLAAASLAQVHPAVLKSGEAVVVKVQRPNVQDIIEIDLAILRDLAARAQHTDWGERNQPEAIAEEFDLSLRHELDYCREGHNADRFRENFAGDETIIVPKIYWKYSTRRVLVMEKLSGTKINDTAALDAVGYHRKRVAIDATRLIVKEVLIDGFYHADPHAGNLLVMEDGAIGVMDFGMMGELRGRDRECLTHLFIDACSQDADGIVDELMRLSATGRSVNRARLVGDLNRLFQKYVGLSLEELKFQQIMADITPIMSRHHLRIPANLWLLLKAVVMMEGVGTQLDPDYDFFVVAEPIVDRLKRQMLVPSVEWDQAVFHQGVEWAETARLLPRASRRLLERVNQNDPFEVELRDWEKILSRVSRLINRLSLSVIVAALVIGLSILIATTTKGSPVQALIATGLLGVVIFGIWLLISIIRGK